QAVQVGAHRARFKVRLVGRGDGVDIRNIFRRLFGNDVQSVVDGDDTDEPVFLVNNGNGKQVVLGEVVRNFLFVGERIGVDVVVFHEGTDLLVEFMQQKVLYRHDADQLSLLVGNIAGIDRFLA